MDAHSTHIVGGTFYDNRLCIRKTYFTGDRLLAAIDVRADRYGLSNWHCQTNLTAKRPILNSGK
jgi:hypothetical protein